MASQLFNNFQQSNPLGNMMNLINNLNQYRSQFNGDPKQIGEQMLNSGQFGNQFNQLAQMATQIQKMLMNK